MVENRTVVVMTLTMWFLSSWGWFMVGIWKGLELQAGKSLKHCRQSLIGSSGGILEDKNAERNVGCGGAWLVRCQRQTKAP